MSINDSKEEIRYRRTLELIENAAKRNADFFELRTGATELPPEIGLLTNVTKLKLSFNKIKALPDELAHLTKLKRIFIQGNHLEEFPKVLTEIKSLVRIDIHNNRIRKIPPEIVNLQNLKRLSTSNNEIVEICDELFYLKNLGDLHIYHNKISFIPKSIEYALKLNKLLINDNFIKSLPEEIGNLKSLREINLKNNSLNDLPFSILNLRLKSLDISGNPFTNMPKLKEIEGLPKIFKSLEKYGKKNYSKFIRVKKEFKFAIKQYFLFFKEFYEMTEGLELEIFITEEYEGLRFEIELSDKIDIRVIEEKILEYISFAIEEEYLINSKRDLSPIEVDILVLDLKNQVAHLNNSLEIAKTKLKLQEMEINSLNNQNQYLKSFTESLIKNKFDILESELGVSIYSTNDKIKQSLGNSRTEMALDLLIKQLQKLNKRELNDALLIKAQLKKLKSDKITGIINREEEQIQLNKINSSILNMIE